MEEPAIYRNPSYSVNEHHDSLSKVTKSQSHKKAQKAAEDYLIPEPETRSQVASRPSQNKASKIDEQVTYYEPTPEVEKRPLHSPPRSSQTLINAKTETIQLKRDVKRDRTLLIALLCISAITFFVALVALVVSVWGAFTPSSTTPGTTGGVVQLNQTSVNQDCLTVTCSANLNDNLDTLNQQVGSLAQETDQRIDSLDQQVNQRFLTLDQLNQRFVSSDEVNGMFAPSSQLQEVRNSISALETSIQNISSSLPLRLDTVCTIHQVSGCGSGDWRRVAYINMSYSSQQCPSSWREYSSPVRSCGRPVTSSGGCPSTSFGTCGFAYSRVCGRSIGYQYGTPDAYSRVDVPNHPPITSPSDIYVDGVSVTHGNPTRTHIWTFAAGHSHITVDFQDCPCDNPRASGSPSFVGNNYFCEVGATNEATVPGQFYPNNRLWDGTGCVSGSSCCTFNSPPWFSVQLSSSTSDDIEVRICGDKGTDNEDTPIELLELYVQ